MSAGLTPEALEFGRMIDQLPPDGLRSVAAKARKMAEADNENRQHLLDLAEGIEDMAIQRDE